MPKRSIFLMVALLVAAFAIFILWMALAQHELTVYDPRSFEPYGLKAIHLLMAKAGYRIKVTETIGGGFGDQLLIITTKSRLPKTYRRKILDWVEAGGTVLELAGSRPVFYSSLRAIKPVNVNRQNRVYHPAQEVGIKLKYHLGGDLVYISADPDQGLVGKKGRFVIYIENYGAGRIIHWNDPDGLTNLWVRKFPDNAVLFALLVKKYVSGKRIVFCYKPALAEKTSANTGNQSERYWFGGFLLLVGAGLLLWKLTVRFGRPRPLILAKGRSADEFIYSMAALFQQADLKAMVLDNLYRRLLQAIGNVTGLPVNSDWETMKSYLVSLAGKEYTQKAAAAVELYRKYHGHKISKAGFLELANQLDRCRKELSEWKM